MGSSLNSSGFFPGRYFSSEKKADCSLSMKSGKESLGVRGEGHYCSRGIQLSPGPREGSQFLGRSIEMVNSGPLISTKGLADLHQPFGIIVWGSEASVRPRMGKEA